LIKTHLSETYPKNNVRSEKQNKGHIVKIYDYVDPDGNLLFQVCRKDNKDFLQRQPGDMGSWIYNLNGIQRVLYRLPEVLKAKEVIIVEGEKDVDNLRALGLTATTSPGGSKSWKNQYVDHLKGKNIVLIPDNDNEGREYMTGVAESLNGRASLKWVTLPGVPKKGDASDYIARFSDKDEAAENLSILIENARPYEPTKNPTINNCILDIDDFCSLDVESRKEYLSPWIKEGSIGLISAQHGTGKTWFAMGILDEVSRGISFGPWQCENPVHCLLLDGELPQADIIERKNTLIQNPNRKYPFYVYSDAHANRLGLPRAHLANNQWRKQMKEILTAREVKLWAIDNIASLAAGLD
jgi:hypothetical protein